MCDTEYYEIVLRFYRQNKIEPSQILAENIQSNNSLSLKYISYAIRYLLAVPGINELLVDIAVIRGIDKVSKRIFHNYIQELHAIYFVRCRLKHKILQVESRSNKIFSPFRRGDKSCDILSHKNGKQFYFESKDFSSFLLSSNNDLPKFHTAEEEAERWIMRKAKDADVKGANYLICRPEVWAWSDSEEEPIKYLTGEWIEAVCSKCFIKYRRISNYEILVTSKNALSSHFMGIYIIKKYDFVKLRICH